MPQCQGNNARTSAANGRIILNGAKCCFCMWPPGLDCPPDWPFLLLPPVSPGTYVPFFLFAVLHPHHSTPRSSKVDRQDAARCCLLPAARVGNFLVSRMEMAPRDERRRRGGNKCLGARVGKGTKIQSGRFSIFRRFFFFSLFLIFSSSSFLISVYTLYGSQDSLIFFFLI